MERMITHSGHLITIKCIPLEYEEKEKIWKGRRKEWEG